MSPKTYKIESGACAMRNPWDAVRRVAKHTAATYEPSDDAPEPGRCDLQLVQDALYAARLAVEGARPGDACNAVAELLRALHRVLTGLSGDVRDLATAAQEAADGTLDPGELPAALGELAGDLVALRGPKP